MSDAEPASSEPLIRRVLGLALTVLLLTSVHHAYGAYIYDTPWRLHVVFVGGITAAALLVLFAIFRRRPAEPSGRLAFRAFAAVALTIPVAAIGLFEGGYNHVLKNALYLAGASAEVMHRLFPPPTYELPNDLFFEITGVLQLLLGVATGYQLILLLRESRRRARRAPGAAADR